MSGKAPTDLVLDASVAIKWYVPEGLGIEALRLMSPRFSMYVPSFFAAECGNTIWKKAARLRELDRGDGREILDELLAYPKQVHNAEELTMLAEDGHLRFIYLALAVAPDYQMVTADRLFRDIPRAIPFGYRLL